MAKSAALGFTLAGAGAIAIISGIQGKSVAEVLKGEIGPSPEPAFAGNTTTEEGSAKGIEGSSSAGAIEANTKGLISPFPKGTRISWGRNDQGVDGTTPPGTPLYAMGNGTVSIAHNPTGFGANYVVLHIDGDGSYYYGHGEPLVSNGARVTKGQPIARTHQAPSWGNSTTPGGFEIGKLGPHGEYPKFSGPGSGVSIRSFLQNLPQI